MTLKLQSFAPKCWKNLLPVRSKHAIPDVSAASCFQSLTVNKFSQLQRKRLARSISLSLILMSNPAFAMFCPNGFNQMNIGDTIDQVVQQCGNPDFKKTTKKEPGQPQEWNYYVKLEPKQTTTIKMSVAFDAKEAVTNITTNSQSLIDTSLCGGKIKIGDKMETVKAACGTPAFINENKPSSDQTPNPNTTEITQFKYNTTPPVVLIFENNKLKERTSSSQ